MPISYKVCGSGDIPAHVCNACTETEQGGVRGGAFILASYIPRDANGLISVTVEDFSWWETGINDGKIIVIPKTRGTFDGGSAVTSAGFGDLSEIVTGKRFTVVMNDPDHTVNEEFYAMIANAPGAYHFAWRTDNELRISETPVNIDPVDNTEEDVNSQVTWSVNITWNQKKKTVQVFTLNKQVFQCFDTTGDAFYSMPSWFSQFPNTGGEQTLMITSTVDGNTESFSIQGIPPNWAHPTITGNRVKVIAEANTGDARNYELVLIQNETGKTLTKNIPQSAYIPVTCFRYGWDNTDSYDVTEQDIVNTAKTTRNNPKANDSFQVPLNPGNVDTWRRQIISFPDHLTLSQFNSVITTQNPFTITAQSQWSTMVIDGITYKVGVYVSVASNTSNDAYNTLLT